MTARRLYRRRHTRASAAKRGYDRAWRAASAAYLAENPLCRSCQDRGRLTSAQCVDHIRPVRDGQRDPLFWSTANWQPLCHSCHSKKTRREQRPAKKAARPWPKTPPTSASR